MDRVRARATADMRRTRFTVTRCSRYRTQQVKLGGAQATVWYEEAEKELGVSADVDEQRYCDIEFSPGYK
jgi:hypothetical protein